MDVPEGLTEAPELPDQWKTILWRQDELERAGWPTVPALDIALRLEIDLHEACDLVRNGATWEQALRIML